MEKTKFVEAIKKLKADSPKRKFTQRVEVIFSLKDLDLKKQDHQVDVFAQMPFTRGKPVKICAFVGPELKEEAMKICDKVIEQSEFHAYADKKKAKKLADDFDFFIAQANIMAAIASTFGKVFGPRNKMPNPKAGCVMPPKATLKPLYEKLQTTVRIAVKTQPQLQCSIGTQESSDEELVENIQALYTQLINHLPNHEQNVRATYLKFTMSKPVKVV